MGNQGLIPDWIVIHHSATDELCSVTKIRQAHLDRGWDDIGYHWLIDQQGFLHKGRPDHIPGAHVLGFNERSLGICVIGNFDLSAISDAAFETLGNFLCILCVKYAIPVENIIGHNDAPNASSTDCPGLNLKSLLPELRKFVYDLVLNSKHRAVNRSIFFCGLIHNGINNIIQGLIFNTGVESWALDQNAPERIWRVGGRLILGNLAFWEGRSEIGPFPIATFEFRQFSFILDQSNNLSEGTIFEADLLLEHQFWATDLGLAPVRLLVGAREIATGDKFEGRLLVLPFEQIGKAHLKIVGKVKNVSARVWTPTDSIVVVAELSADSNPRMAMAQTRLQCLPLEFGDAGMFSILLTMPSAQLDSYKLIIRLIDLSKSIEICSTTAHFKFPLIASSSDQFPYDCTVILEKVSILHNFILIVKGTVCNTGLLSWDNSQGPRDSHFRVGARLFQPGSAGTPFWETRYELPADLVLPSEKFPFSIETSLADMPPGKHRLEVEMVKEQEFWFSTLGKSAAFAEVEVLPRAAPAIIVRDKVEHLLIRSPKGVRVLVIAPTLPLYDREAGGKRLLELLKLLVEIGCVVTYVYESPGVDDRVPYVKRIEDEGVRVSGAPLTFIAEMGRADADLCIISWYRTAVRTMPLVRNILPNCKIIVDSVDVHWIRAERGVVAGEIKNDQQALSASKKEEIAVYAQADTVWAVTEEDRSAILKEVPSCEVMIVPYLTSPRLQIRARSYGKAVLFVGSFNHPPNESAAIWSHQICSQFREQTGQPLVLYIVGANPPPSVKGLHNGVQTIVTGFVPDLDPYYEKCDLLLSPLKYGAGIKGKICDAISAGLCVATTPVGNEGLGLINNTEAFILNQTDQFVGLLKDIFIDDKFDLKTINKTAQQKVIGLTGLAAGRETIEASIAYGPVTICIVTYNKKELLQRCLDSLFSKTNYPDYHVAVLSNGCTDGTQELLEQYKKDVTSQISVYLRNENQFFVKPSNFLIDQFRSSDIVLMNNDIEIIEEDWLIHLYRAAYTSHLIGAAGGLILDPQGRVSEAGCAIQQNGYGVNLGRGTNPLSADIQKPRYVGFVSGCLLYMKRSAISAYGALDEDFQPMYYEDAAWQYSLHRHGLKTIFTPLCKAVHHEGSTAGQDLSQGMKRYQEINREKFLAKFADMEFAAMVSE
jgi:GT2 family glycosyltransferase